MRHLTRARSLAIGGLIVAGLVLASCGGSSSHAATVPTTTPGNNAQAQGQNGQAGQGGARISAFRTCMSQHGITLPQRARNGNGNGGPPSTTPGDTRPGFGGFGNGGRNRFQTPPPGVDPTKYQNALKACQSQLPTGDGNFRNNSAFQAYASCLKDHGVTIPPAGSGNRINRNDPKYAAAFKTCAPLRPSFGGTTPTTTAATQ
jgi:hypothetical protein